MADPKTQIRQLLALINKSAEEAILEYEKTSTGVPAPGQPHAHELDSAPDAVELKSALRVLEGACESLCTTLAQPMHTLMNRSMPFEAQCIRIAINYKIADALRTHPQGRHIDNLAKDTGLNAGKLVHVMRLLATRGCFNEVALDTFTNNRVSLNLVSTNPVADILGLFSEECTLAVNSLYDVLKDPEYGPDITPLKSSFMYSVKGEMSEGSFFDWLNNHTTRRERFGRAMIGWSTLTGSMAVVKHFPWNKYKTFCDVGSGLGHLSLALVRAHPHLDITLQDLPGPLQAAKGLWNKEFSSGVTSGKVKFVELDFMKQAPVANQDIYYLLIHVQLKHIIHSWPDQVAVGIMKKLASVLPPNGRVLIHEFVTQSAAESAYANDAGLERAPLPLLPNYGSGQVRTYSQDVTMMSIFNALERNIDDFAKLGKESGLELVKAWDYAETVVIEYKLQGA
ncbi:S-adenosyl-L-methionine-dependent methyltransferase [Flagelloscypha sp. PMI_526]|nr:S-adenosyl-L-methionine-dependent methyltransferase [Flagelloscypha sp. PMI_526]